ncbi:MAG: single-stranded DNA-binding protein [Clostridia bacterium]|nr:single-stranded DNA-binding protein [Clostridia bacterium]
MLNLVALMGRLTDEPELRHTTNGTPVVSFTLAVERRFKSGEERTADFINIVAWRQSAEFVSKYFRKGQLVAVDGSIQTRRYQDKDGNNRTAFEVVANNVHFAEPKRDSAPAREDGFNAAPAAFSNTDAGDFAEIATDEDLPF